MSTTPGELTVALDGRDQAIVLRRPRYAEIAPYTVEPLEMTASQRHTALRLALRADVATVGGEAMRLATADRLIASPQALAEVLEARNRAYERDRAAGEAWALCPHCGRGEAKVSLLSFATRFGALPPEMTAADPVYLLPPSLSIGHPAGARPAGAPLASSIRFRLPSQIVEPSTEERVGEGVMQTIDPARMERLWERFAPEGKEQPDERVWWRRGNPCFRALLALASAVARPDGRAVSPIDLVDVLAVDMYFLDALYYLTHHVDVTTPAPTDECGACGHRFYPLLSQSRSE